MCLDSNPINRYEIKIGVNNGIIDQICINFDDKNSLEFGNKMKYRIPTSAQKLENKMYLRNNQIGKKTKFFMG